MRHRWMVYIPYEVTVEDGLRLIGAIPMKGGDLPDIQLAKDERPAPDDERPYFGTHNLVRDLVTVGCYNCEQPLTKDTANSVCPGQPYPHAQPTEDLGKPAPGILRGVGRNEKCPCGSGKKFKHCHGSRT